MVKLYALKIRRGEMTLDDVPEFWRDAVAAAVAEENAAKAETTDEN